MSTRENIRLIARTPFSLLISLVYFVTLIYDQFQFVFVQILELIFVNKVNNLKFRTLKLATKKV